jgi:hypothetical protein
MCLTFCCCFLRYEQLPNVLNHLMSFFCQKTRFTYLTCTVEGPFKNEKLAPRFSGCQLKCNILCSYKITFQFWRMLKLKHPLKFNVLLTE